MPLYSGDFFDRARAVATATLLVAGVLAIVGSLIDWVTVTPPDVLPPDEAPKAIPFTGIEAGDGRWVLGAGVVVVVAAMLLFVRRRAGYAWSALVASVVIGGIAISDFRSVNDGTSDLLRRMDRVGDLDPGLGLVLVATAAILGLLGAAAGVASSPRRELSEA